MTFTTKISLANITTGNIMRYFLPVFISLLIASPCFSIGPYTNNGDTVYDQATGLTWMQQTADTNTDGSITLDDALNWQNALAYCEGLELSAYSDWRMPNIRELKSLVDYRASLAAVLDPVFQYETAYDANYYWSSTTGLNTGYTDYALDVCFGNGIPGQRNKITKTSYVRCVRGGVDGPKIQIDITSDTDIVYSGRENFGFSVTVNNTGEIDLSAVPVSVEHATVFSYPDWKCIEEATSENATCTLNASSATGATFSANIPAGGYITIEGTGDIAAIPVALTVTAPGAVETVIRGLGPPADLPSTEEVKICSKNGCTPDDDLGIDLSKDTIVLTHGLQPEGCEREKLWTSFNKTPPPDNSNPAPAGYLLNQKYNENVNVLQFFWRGACQEHGLGDYVPTQNAYEKGRKNVYHAGEQLAYLLLQNLSVMYSKKIHFIGHSLGTAVTAYAANIFLRQASYLTEAQVTLLDYPNSERVDKMFDGFNRANDREWARKYGFDKNFFASTLPSDIDRPFFHLHVDNYFSAEPAIDSKATAGVGSTINGKSFYNHYKLQDPHTIDDLFLEDEGIANDHSGVHQWYRWSIKPNEEENFEGASVCNSGEWNKKPLVSIFNSSKRCDSAVGACTNLGDKNPSLNPCNTGWRYSIIDSSVTFPGGNGKEVDKTSSFGIEPSNVTEYGCAAGGISGSYICREDNQALAPQAAAAEFAAMDSTEPEDAPDRFYIELDVNVPEFVRYISFDYTFTNEGDGDYVYLFAEGESIWLMSGNDAQQGEIQSSGQIPLRMTAGANKLVVALYGVGEKNAEFEIKNLKFTTVFDSDGDGCADDEDDFPEDPKRCIENKTFPWIMFYPAFVAGSGTSVPETFSVTATAGSNGSLSSGTPSPQSIRKNKTATFTFNADSDYYVSSISGCGISYTNSDQSIINKNATTLSVINNCEVISSFAPIPVASGTCTDRGLSGPEAVNWQGRDWQRCDDEDYYNWNEAIAYCENLTLNGYDDWRLPTKDELKDLVVCSNGTLTPLQDYDSCQDGNNLPYDTPTIDGSFECSSDCFWSSSAYNQFNSWYVCFSNGFAGSWGRPVDDYFRARCVR